MGKIKRSTMIKYRYYAPNDIGITDPQWEFLKLLDRKVVKIISYDGEYRIISQWNYDYPEFKVSAEDLREIEEGPKKPHEIVKGLHPDCDTCLEYGWDKQFTYSDALEFVRQGEKNDRKRTQPVIDFVESLLNTTNGAVNEAVKLSSKIALQKLR
jgi:hypothetical protein